MHFGQKQTLRRCWGGGRKGGFRVLQQLSEVLDWPSIPADIHHGSNQVSDHMMKEAIGCYQQGYPLVLPGNPLGFHDSTPIPSCLLPHLCKGLEGMLPREEGGSLVEEIQIHLFDDGPTPGPSEGGECRFREPKLVSITPGPGVVPGMEGVGDHGGPFYPDI